MDDTRSTAASRQAVRISALLSVVVGATGLLALAGWAFDVRRLADWDLDGVAQMPNNAIGVIAASAALLCAAMERRLAARILAALAALIAAATLFEHATAIDLGIDTLILHRSWGQAGTVVPGRMGLPGSITLAIVGFSVLMVTTRRLRAAATAGGLVVTAVAMLSLIGYLFDADRLYAIPRLTTIALQTSTMMLVLGAALVAAVPERGLTRLLVSDSSAGLLVRRALPAILVLPPILGWLGVRGQNEGLFDTAFGTAMLVLTLIGLLIALLWRGAAMVLEHEEQLRSSHDRIAGILDSITDAFVAVDSNWRFAFVNHTAETLLGRSREELTGRVLWEVAPEAQEDRSRRHLERAMRERISVEYEAFYPAWNRWFAHRAYPAADGGLAVYSRDVSERKLADETLRRSAEALRAADRMKDEFLATLSHELRTPLTAIIGWSEILLRADLEARDRNMALETIRSSARAQAQLVDDVLDVSRIITGKMRLHRSEAELHAIVEAAVATVRPAAEAKRIALSVDVDRSLPVAFVDPERVRQIVWNLLSNAIKFSPEGTEVGVELRGDGDGAVIVVSDRGPGIAPEFLPHVFERFRQADSSATRAHSGLGLGLALSKDLVELHGGTIAVESELHAGSRFTVRLPTGAGAPASPAATVPAASQGAPLEGVRVLYVDDREDARLLIRTMLQRHGADVAAAESVDGALAALSVHRPHVVVTDLAMPGRDGYDLLSAIRADRQWDALPVLALTAQARRDDEERAAGAGFRRFLRKPIESEELSAAVASVLRDSEREA